MYNMLILYYTHIHHGEIYEYFRHKYESCYGKKKREFSRAGNVAATIGLKLSDVTFLNNHNDSNKISTEQKWTFSISTQI
jgi:methionine salvage enolase-phosphatase E1